MGLRVIAIDPSQFGTGTLTMQETDPAFNSFVVSNITTGALTTLDDIIFDQPFSLNITYGVVPEPSALALVGVAAAGAAWRAWRRVGRAPCSGASPGHAARQRQPRPAARSAMSLR